jgi:hypothetical protein
MLALRAERQTKRYPQGFDIEHQERHVREQLVRESARDSRKKRSSEAESEVGHKNAAG